MKTWVEWNKVDPSQMYMEQNLMTKILAHRNNAEDEEFCSWGLGRVDMESLNLVGVSLINRESD